MEQLALIPAPPAQPRLTDRQQRALDLISRLAPIPSDELGAYLHRHGPDSRCQWCATTGAEVGEALRRKGLVKRRRGKGWVLMAGAADKPADPVFGEFPEGF